MQKYDLLGNLKLIWVKIDLSVLEHGTCLFTCFFRHKSNVCASLSMESAGCCCDRTDGVYTCRYV